MTSPTDKELLELAAAELDNSPNWEEPEYSAGHPFPYEAPGVAWVNFARAVLARWGRPAPPPAEGEVEELVALLRAEASDDEIKDNLLWMTPANARRAADLLERLVSPACVVLKPSPELIETFQDALLGRIELLPGDAQRHPDPVPVTERLPGPEDCDAEGRCWLFSKVEKEWRLIDAGNPGVPHLKYCFSHWLPAHALPLPSGEVE